MQTPHGVHRWRGGLHTRHARGAHQGATGIACRRARLQARRQCRARLHPRPAAGARHRLASRYRFARPRVPRVDGQPLDSRRGRRPAGALFNTRSSPRPPAQLSVCIRLAYFRIVVSCTTASLPSPSPPHGCHARPLPQPLPTRPPTRSPASLHHGLPANPLVPVPDHPPPAPGGERPAAGRCRGWRRPRACGGAPADGGRVQ